MTKQNIHILGICGTFMGGLAVLARSLGFEVSGSDQNVYPPMSDQLNNLGIAMHQGYDDSVLSKPYGEVVVGNVMTRGMPVIESLLTSTQHFSSGPQWLGEYLLRHKKVFAVAGTHGKTTTSSMLAWILEDNQQNPGFLIGGVAQDFDISARNTDAESFVIEADEYDSAFFDKRSKFVHYHANVAILNNLEYDHADIFEDLDAIKKQFHHFVRTIPSTGLLVVNNDDSNIKSVLKMGCWTPIMTFGSNNSADVYAQENCSDFSSFDVYYQNIKQCTIQWNLTGRHNMLNALAAMTAAFKAGVSFIQSSQSLQLFQGIKRRMELVGKVNGITVYDDFAHHPTAILTTIEGIKNSIGDKQLIVVVEPRSNSMRSGAHAQALPNSLKKADLSIVMNYPNLSWQQDVFKQMATNGVKMVESVENLFSLLVKVVQPECHVVFMSNGGFDNAPRRFIQKLQC
jgi:UDP-N-acetylmuramate: L-alanyl-gamma-D-glutamyl-meso-diaminopimelate ligase